MRLFVPRNNERIITKKRKEKNDQEMRSSRNDLSTFLYLRYCNTIMLCSLYIHPFSTRAYALRKDPEAIVIVSATGRLNKELL